MTHNASKKMKKLFRKALDRHEQQTAMPVFRKSTIGLFVTLQISGNCTRAAKAAH